MIEQLTWDSDFFGFNVGKVTALKGERINFHDLLLKSKSDNYRLIYLFSEDAISEDMVPVDVKIVYSMPIENDGTHYEVLPEVHEATNSLYSLAYRSGDHSRFRLDKNFEKGKFEELYNIWVENSLSGKFADKVFKYEVNGEIVAFVTVAIKDHVAIIGLIAVSENYGRRGIGSKLINAVKSYALERGCKTLNVATQQDNIEACMFYEKNGFSLYSKTYIYHLWL